MCRRRVLFTAAEAQHILIIIIIIIIINIFHCLPLFAFHAGLEIVTFLSALCVRVLQKGETFREGISCCCCCCFFTTPPPPPPLPANTDPAPSPPHCAVAGLSCQGLQPHFTQRRCPGVDIIRSRIVGRRGRVFKSPLAVDAAAQTVRLSRGLRDARCERNISHGVTG